MNADYSAMKAQAKARRRGAASRREAQTAPQTQQANTNRVPVMLAHIAWVVTAVSALALFGLSVPARTHQLSNPPYGERLALRELNLTPDFYTTYLVRLELAFAAAFFVISLVILWRKPRDLTAIFISLMLLLIGTSSRPILPTMDALIKADDDWTPIVRLMSFATWSMVFIFFCIFPDGKFVPGWSRYYAAAAILISIPWNLWPDSPLSPWTWPGPVLLPFEILIWGTGLYIQVYRYRHYSNKMQQQQTKWIVFGLSIAMSLIAIFYLPRLVQRDLAEPVTREAMLWYLITSTMVTLAGLVLPVAISISILRYKLWNIDLIINRTLVYVPLTAVLAGAYTASVTLFQRVFVALTGDTSDAAVVMSTLILASLFTPVKNSLQTAVDKRFKEAPDPAKKLEAFTGQVEEMLELLSRHRMAERLVKEAVAAFGARGGAIYLGTRGYMRLEYSSDDWDGDAALTVPLKCGEATLGLVSIGPRHDKLPYTTHDREALQEVSKAMADATCSAELSAMQAAAF